MRCPVDKSDMMVVEHEKIELDYCLQCRGVWFDANELELLVSTLIQKGDSSQNNLFVPQEARVKEGRRKCPVCGHKMDKVWLGQGTKVLIDRCPLGDGLWFDGGELGQILQQIHLTGSSTGIVSFLGETFQGNYRPENGK